MKQLLCGVVMLYLYATACGQVKEMSPGDRFVQDELINILGGTNPGINTSGLKQKAVLLDFFATWCLPCIAGLTKLDSIQSQFENDLQIILVTRESAEKVCNAKQKHASLRQSKLPLITSDTVLSKLFPHRMVPHLVWLDKDKYVKAITHAHDVKTATIDSLIRGNELNLQLKKDVISFDREKSLLENEVTARAMLYGSTLIKGMSGMSSGRLIAEVDCLKIRHSYVNWPVLELYVEAARLVHAPNHVVLDVKDSTQYLLPENTPYSRWSDGKTYSYEQTILKNTPEDQRKTWMMQELTTNQVSNRIEGAHWSASFIADEMIESSISSR